MANSGISFSNISKETILSSFSECSGKDDILVRYAKATEEAITGWEKAEAEVAFLKKELDENWRQRVAAEERVAALDSALKECMQQLRFFRDEQERSSKVTKPLTEFRKENTNLGEKLNATSTRLAKLGNQNSNLSKSHQVDKLIKDLSECKPLEEARFYAFKARLDLVEKDNSSLRYEISLPRKKFEMRNKVIEIRHPSAHTAHKEQLEGVKETQFEDMQTTMDLRRAISSNDLHRGPSLRAVHIDEADGPESLASTLMSELRYSAKRKPEESLPLRTIEVSDMSLMDDFEEMEKLAKSSSFSDTHSSEISAFLNTLEIQLQGNPSKASDCEMVSSDGKEGMSKDQSVGKYPIWLQDIIKLILEQNRIGMKSPDEILNEVRNAFADICHLGPSEVPNARKDSQCFGSTDSLQNYCDTWRPPDISPKACSFCASHLNLSSKELKKHQLEPGLRKSLSKLIELIGGVYRPQSLDYNIQNMSENNGNTLLYNNSATSSGFTVRVFLWKSSELDHLLSHFINTCTDVLNGNVDLQALFAELHSTLDWIMNHCFSVKDVSSIRDTFKNQFNWDDALSDCELEDAVNYPFSEAESKEPSDEMTLQFQSASALNGWNDLFGSKEIQLNPKEANRRLKEKISNMESVQQDLEGKLHSGTKKIENLMTQLRELEDNMCCLQMELKASEESKGLIEDQLEKFKLCNEDRESMLRVLSGELKEAHLKLSSFGVETERKICSCNESEAACPQQHFVMDSVMKKGVTEFVQEDRQLQMDFDITAASEKLAECQETLLILGKQLKELDSPKEPNLLDEVVSTITAAIPGGKNSRHRHASSSLLYHMRAEDSSSREYTESPKTKEVICTNIPCSHAPLGSIKSPEKFIHSSTSKTKFETGTRATLTVNSKNCGGGVSLMRKLLLGSKRESGKKSLNMVGQV